MRIDVNSFVGAYPYRKVPGTSPDDLLRAMDRTGIDEAWVSHLPSVFWRDPAEGNAWLYQVTDDEPRLRPVPAVHPGLAHWEEIVAEAADRGAPAVRCDPMFYALAPDGGPLRALCAACADADLPLLMAVKLEDGRQRHPHDVAGDLPPWAVRHLLRAEPRVRLVVTH